MRRILRSVWCYGVLVAGIGVMLLPTPSLQANPVLDQVVEGTLLPLDRSVPGVLTIQQLTDQAVVDWQSFNINPDEATVIEFYGPGAGNSSILNRVSEANPAAILGMLKSTIGPSGAGETIGGKVFVYSPSGILFGENAQVNVGDLTASTLEFNLDEYLNGGDLNLGGENQSLAGIEIEKGSQISVLGDVVLVAHTVSNEGTITAGERISLAAGTQVTLKQEGAERITVRAGAGNGETAAAGISNMGTLESVVTELQAAGGNVYALAINHGGAVRASRVVRENGRVFLRARSSEDGSTGSINSFGEISAAGVTVDADISVLDGTIDAGEGQLTVDGTANIVASEIRGQSQTYTGDVLFLGPGDQKLEAGDGTVSILGQGQKVTTGDLEISGSSGVFVGGSLSSLDGGINTVGDTVVRGTEINASEDVRVAGSVLAGDIVASGGSVDISGDAVLSGNVSGAEGVSVENLQLTTSTGHLVESAQGGIAVRGDVTKTETGSVTFQSPEGVVIGGDLGADSGAVTAFSDLSLGGNLRASSATLGGDLQLTGGDAQSVGELSTKLDIRGAVSKPSNGGLSIRGNADSVIGGSIVSGGSLNLEGPMAVQGDLQGVGVIVAGGVEFSGGDQTIDAGAPGLTAFQGLDKASPGSLQLVGQGAKVLAGDVRVRDGRLVSSGELIARGNTVEASEGIVLEGGSIAARVISGGVTSSGGDVELIGDSELAVEGSVVVNDGRLRISAESVVLNGSVQAEAVELGGSVEMVRSGDQALEAVGGQISVSGNLRKTTDGILMLNAAEGSELGGDVLVTDGRLEVQGPAIVGGQIEARGVEFFEQLILAGDGMQGIDGGTGRAVAGDGTSGVYLGGQVSKAQGDLRLSAQRGIDVDQGIDVGNGRLVVESGLRLAGSLSAREVSLLSGVVLDGQGQSTISASAGAVEVEGLLLGTGADLVIAGVSGSELESGVMVNGLVQMADGDLSSLSSLSVSGDVIVSDGNVLVGDSAVVGGQVLADGDVNVSGDLSFIGTGRQELRSSSGSLFVGGTVSKAAGDLNVVGGQAVNLGRDVNVAGALTLNGGQGGMGLALGGNVSAEGLTVETAVNLTGSGDQELSGGSGTLQLPETSKANGSLSLRGEGGVTLLSDVELSEGGLSVEDRSVVFGDLQSEGLTLGEEVVLGSLEEQRLSAGGGELQIVSATKASGDLDLSGAGGVRTSGLVSVDGGTLTVRDALHLAGDLRARAIRGQGDVSTESTGLRSLVASGGSIELSGNLVGESGDVQLSGVGEQGVTVGGLTRIESGSLQTVGGASFGGDVTASGNLEFGGAVVLSGGEAQAVISTGGAVVGSGSLNKAAGDLNVSGVRGVTVSGDVASGGALALNGGQDGTGLVLGGNVSAEGLTVETAVNLTGSGDQQLSAGSGALQLSETSKANGSLSLRGEGGVTLLSDVELSEGGLSVEDRSVVFGDLQSEGLTLGEEVVLGSLDGQRLSAGGRELQIVSATKPSGDLDLSGAGGVRTSGLVSVEGGTVTVRDALHLAGDLRARAIRGQGDVSTESTGLRSLVASGGSIELSGNLVGESGDVQLSGVGEQGVTVGGLTRIESGSLQTVGGASFGGDVTASGNLEFGGAVALSGGEAQAVSSTGGAVIGSGSLNKAAGDLNVSGARGVTVNGDVASGGALALNGGEDGTGLALGGDVNGEGVLFETALRLTGTSEQALSGGSGTLQASEISKLSGGLRIGGSGGVTLLSDVGVTEGSLNVEDPSVVFGNIASEGLTFESEANLVSAESQRLSGGSGVLQIVSATKPTGDLDLSGAAGVRTSGLVSVEGGTVTVRDALHLAGDLRARAIRGQGDVRTESTGLRSLVASEGSVELSGNLVGESGDVQLSGVGEQGVTVGGLTRIESGSLQTVGGASFGGDVTASGNLEFGGAVLLSGGEAQAVSSTGGAVVGSGSLNKAAGDLNVSGARGVSLNGDVASGGALALNGGQDGTGLVLGGNVSAEGLTVETAVNLTGSGDQQLSAGSGALQLSETSKANGSLSLRGEGGVTLLSDVELSEGGLSVEDRSVVFGDLQSEGLTLGEEVVLGSLEGQRLSAGGGELQIVSATKPSGDLDLSGAGGVRTSGLVSVEGGTVTVRDALHLAGDLRARAIRGQGDVSTESTGLRSLVASGGSIELSGNLVGESGDVQLSGVGEQGVTVGGLTRIESGSLQTVGGASFGGDVTASGNLEFGGAVALSGGEAQAVSSTGGALIGSGSLNKAAGDLNVSGARGVTVNGDVASGGALALNGGEDGTGLALGGDVNGEGVLFETALRLTGTSEQALSGGSGTLQASEIGKLSGGLRIGGSGGVTLLSDVGVTEGSLNVEDPSVVFGNIASEGLTFESEANLVSAESQRLSGGSGVLQIVSATKPTGDLDLSGAAGVRTSGLVSVEGGTVTVRDALHLAGDLRARAIRGQGDVRTESTGLRSLVASEGSVELSGNLVGESGDVQLSGVGEQGVTVGGLTRIESGSLQTVGGASFGGDVTASGNLEFGGAVLLSGGEAQAVSSTGGAVVGSGSLNKAAGDLNVSGARGVSLNGDVASGGALALNGGQDGTGLVLGGNVSAEGLTVETAVNLTGSGDQQLSAGSGALQLSETSKANGSLSLRGEGGVTLLSDVELSEGGLSVEDRSVVFGDLQSEGLTLVEEVVLGSLEGQRLSAGGGELQIVSATKASGDLDLSGAGGVRTSGLVSVDGGTLTVRDALHLAGDLRARSIRGQGDVRTESTGLRSLVASGGSVELSGNLVGESGDVQLSGVGEQGVTVGGLTRIESGSLQTVGGASFGGDVTASGNLEFGGAVALSGGEAQAVSSTGGAVIGSGSLNKAAGDLNVSGARGVTVNGDVASGGALALNGGEDGTGLALGGDVNGEGVLFETALRLTGTSEQALSGGSGTLQASEIGKLSGGLRIGGAGGVTLLSDVEVTEGSLNVEDPSVVFGNIASEGLTFESEANLVSAESQRLSGGSGVLQIVSATKASGDLNLSGTGGVRTSGLVSVEGGTVTVRDALHLAGDLRARAIRGQGDVSTESTGLRSLVASEGSVELSGNLVGESGDVQLSGVGEQGVTVGGLTRIESGSLQTLGGASFGGDVTASGNLEFGGSVVLSGGGAQTVSSTGGAVIGSDSLNKTAGDLNVSGARGVSLNGDVASGGALALNGGQDGTGLALGGNATAEGVTVETVLSLTDDGDQQLSAGDGVLQIAGISKGSGNLELSGRGGVRTGGLVSVDEGTLTVRDALRLAGDLRARAIRGQGDVTTESTGSRSLVASGGSVELSGNLVGESGDVLLSGVGEQGVTVGGLTRIESGSLQTVGGANFGGDVSSTGNIEFGGAVVLNGSEAQRVSSTEGAVIGSGSLNKAAGDLNVSGARGVSLNGDVASGGALALNGGQDGTGLALGGNVRAEGVTAETPLRLIGSGGQQLSAGDHVLQVTGISKASGDLDLSGRGGVRTSGLISVPEGTVTVTDALHLAGDLRARAIRGQGDVSTESAGLRSLVASEGSVELFGNLVGQSGDVLLSGIGEQGVKVQGLTRVDSGNLRTLGGADFGGDVSASGNAEFGGRVVLSGAGAQAVTSTGGRVEIAENLESLAGDVVVSAGTDQAVMGTDHVVKVAGTTEVTDGGLSIGGDADFGGDVTASRGIQFGENLVLSGVGSQTVVSSDGSIQVSGSVTKAADDLSLSGATGVRIGSDLSVAGTLELNGGPSKSGIELNGNVRSQGFTAETGLELTNDDDQSLSGGAGALVAAAITKGNGGDLNLSADGGLTLLSDVEVNGGRLTIDDQATVSAGELTADGITVNAPVTFAENAGPELSARDDTLLVNAPIQRARGDLRLGGSSIKATADVVVSDGNLIVANALEAAGTFSGGGGLTILGRLTVPPEESLTLSGGDAQLTIGSGVDGGSQSVLTVEGSGVDVSGDVNFSGGTLISKSRIGFDGNLSGNFDFSDDAEFVGNGTQEVRIEEGNLEAAGNITKRNGWLDISGTGKLVMDGQTDATQTISVPAGGLLLANAIDGKNGDLRIAVLDFVQIDEVVNVENGALEIVVDMRSLSEGEFRDYLDDNAERIGAGLRGRLEDLISSDRFAHIHFGDSVVASDGIRIEGDVMLTQDGIPMPEEGQRPEDVSAAQRFESDGNISFDGSVRKRLGDDSHALGRLVFSTPDEVTFGGRTNVDGEPIPGLTVFLDTVDDDNQQAGFVEFARGAQTILRADANFRAAGFEGLSPTANGFNLTINEVLFSSLGDDTLQRVLGALLPDEERQEAPAVAPTGVNEREFGFNGENVSSTDVYEEERKRRAAEAAAARAAEEDAAGE